MTTKNENNYSGDIIKKYDVNGNYITTDYDAAGRKISVTDAKSNVYGGKYKTIYTYEANRNLIEKQFKNCMPVAEENRKSEK